MAHADFDVTTEPILRGRYVTFWNGHECGGERWEIASADGGYVITGEQALEPPHPLPNRHEYRARLSADWRFTGLDVIWTVGRRQIVATHRAVEGPLWRARIEYDGQVREQQGDFPEPCEVEAPTPLFLATILARRDFAVGGEHEFPLLRIGPPLMAVTPERMIVRCDEHGPFATPFGTIDAVRYSAWLPSEGEERGYSFWADRDGFVLESYEGHDRSRPWMRLVELVRAR
jgi:hypothetical protein